MRPTSPRLTASRANSLWLQWVIGRPLAEGGSQARATIAQICSAVNIAGAPERGASASRSATLSSSVAASQRRRQSRTVLGSTATGSVRKVLQIDLRPGGHGRLAVSDVATPAWEPCHDQDRE